MMAIWPHFQFLGLLYPAIQFAYPGKIGMWDSEIKVCCFANFTSIGVYSRPGMSKTSKTAINKKLCYRRQTVRRAMSVKILSTVETSCTTNAQQIKIMELEGYSWPTCSKQTRLANCHTGVVNKLDCRRPQSKRLPLAKFSKSGVCDKVPEGSTLIFVDSQISL